MRTPARYDQRVSQIIICGAGVVGLTTAMLLARDGHHVTVLERDPEGPPASADEAWVGWRRRGVPHFRQPHNLLPRYRAIVEHELPEVFAALLEAGATWVDLLAQLPPTLTDRAARPDDARFRYATARRPVIEYAHARIAAQTARVDIRRGVKVEGLLVEAGRGGLPQVTGVRSSVGELRADLVVDAMGRFSPFADWLAATGCRAPSTSSQECAFVYYTRYFRGPRLPAALAPTVSPIGTFLILTMPGDNSTWSVTLWAPASDRPLREFRRAAIFERVVRACPLHAHWLDGEPVSGVEVMGSILDRYRRFVVDGEPVATGFAAVGDAAACTNPSAGRGISIGVLHALGLRDLLRSAPNDPRDVALRWDAITEGDIAPWYWCQLAADQHRLEQIDAVREGRAEAVTTVLPLPPRYEAAARAMPYDADVFRAALETVACLALPDEVFGRPGLWAKVEATARTPTPLPGPSRSQLLALLN